jgi:uncharacterized protein (TIGR01244 family)
MRQSSSSVFRPWLVLMVALAAGGAFGAQKPEYPDIKNFLRVDEHYCTGGQPTMDDLVRMKKGGIKTILNLRRPEEFNAEQEATQAEKLGLRYFLIPVDPKQPQDEQVDEFLKVLTNPQNLPVFVHCHTANRVGAFWMIRRVLIDGWPIENAEREAERIGLRSPELRDFARDYIRRHAENSITP